MSTSRGWQPTPGRKGKFVWLEAFLPFKNFYLIIDLEPKQYIIYNYYFLIVVWACIDKNKTDSEECFFLTDRQQASRQEKYVKHTMLTQIYWLPLVDCIIIGCSWINLFGKQIDTSSLISVGLDQIYDDRIHDGIFSH